MAQITDWIAQSYTSNSPPLNASRAVNMFAELEVQDAGSKTPVPVWGCAGTAPFANAGTLGPVLAFKVMNNILYALSGNALYRIDEDGTAHNLGTTNIAPAFVSIDTNGIQLVWVDGLTGWVYQPGGLFQPSTEDVVSGATSIPIMCTGTILLGATVSVTLSTGGTFTTTTTAQCNPGIGVLQLTAGVPEDMSAGAQWIDSTITLAEIQDPQFYPADTVRFFDGYFAFNRKGTKEYFLSPRFAVTPFSATLVAVKEATSDLLVGLENSHEQLYLFGQQRIEVWYDAGNPPPSFPFSRSDGAIIQRGVQAIGSVIVEDNTLFFLGDDSMYYRLDGFRPVRVSNHAVESEWQKYQTLSDCISCIYSIFGHKMLTLTFPRAQKTWVLDLSTKRWHERESWLGSNADTSIGRWRVNCCIFWFNRILLGDSQSGQIAQLNRNVFSEFGAVMRGMVVGPPLHNDRKRVFMKRFELDVESGVGLLPGPSSLVTEFCTTPIQITEPTHIDTDDALLSTPATFPFAVFSGWTRLAVNGDPHGWWFGNQDNDAAPGNGGFQLGVFNNDTSAASHQIEIRAYDAASAIIVHARYAFSTWAEWIWIGISIDCTNQGLEVWINDGLGVEAALTPAAITWSSTNPIANLAGHPWHIQTGSN